MLDVVQVVDQFVEWRGVIFPAYLGEAGDARFHVMTIGILRHLRYELLDEERTLRARAYDAHVAFDNVPYLGQLVEADGADDAADACDAWIVLLRQHGAAVFLRVYAHRAEFVYLEFFAAAAYAGLAV